MEAKKSTKCPILYHKGRKVYMTKDPNCLSAKKYYKTNTVFSFYVVFFKFFVDLFFGNKIIKRYLIYFDLLIVIQLSVSKKI